MITVTVADLFSKVCDLMQDEVSHVEICELNGDKDCPACLSFASVDDDDYSVDYESVESIESEDSSESFHLSATRPAPFLSTLSDLILTHRAFMNAIENCLTELKRSDLSADERSLISSDMKRFDAFAGQLDSFLSQVAPKN